MYRSPFFYLSRSSTNMKNKIFSMQTNKFWAKWYGDVSLAVNWKSVVNAKALSIVRYQDDINTEHNMKSICRAALLKDNAPDSEPLRHWFESTMEQQLLLTTNLSDDINV